MSALMAVGSGPFHGMLCRASMRLTELSFCGHPLASSEEVSFQVDCFITSTKSTDPPLVPKGTEALTAPAESHVASAMTEAAAFREFHVRWFIRVLHSRCSRPSC